MVKTSTGISMTQCLKKTEKDKVPYGLKKKTSANTFIENLQKDDPSASYFVVVGKWSTKVTSGKLTFYNYPLICVVKANNGEYTFYDDPVLPTFIPVFNEKNKDALESDKKVTEDFGVIVLQCVNNQFDYNNPAKLTDEIKDYILRNETYKDIIVKNTPFAYDDIYKEFKTVYTLEYNKNHDLLSFSIDDGKILLSQIKKINRTTKAESKIFDKAADDTMFSRAKPRTNISYKYTVPIEIINELFCKVIDCYRDNKPITTPHFTIVDKKVKYILFGKEYN